MKIYTFNEPIEGTDFVEQAKVIELWKNSWARFGWTPVILTLENVVHHPNYAALLKKAEELPTVNHPVYERFCYLRWLPMCTRGGWFVDWDMINFGFRPNTPIMPATTGHCVGGCGFFGWPSDYRNIIKAFLNYTPTEKDTYNGKPHVSDMTILQTDVIPAKRLNVEKGYGDPGWETAQIVHFGNSRTPRPRSATIERVLRERA